MLKVVHDAEVSNAIGQAGGSVGGSLLDEIVRDGARAMLAAALQAEVAAYIDAHAGEVDEHGRRLVVRNGYHGEREVTTAAGAVPVQAPRVTDKRIDETSGERRRFASVILPAWARKSPQVAEVLPLLYLHGLSTSDFGPALEQFLGSGGGLSAATIGRLTSQWQDEAAAFNKRSLTDTDYVYVWVDGIYLKVRLEQDKVCLLVMIGVRADGTKELIALADGFRESSESWADLLRGCRRRGMRAPVLAVGDGALGFWKALREVFSQTKEQRCWWHRSRKESTCRRAGVRGGGRGRHRGRSSVAVW
jgi:putative transposase